MAAAIALACASTSYATDGNWVGTGPDSYYGTAANWSGNAIPAIAGNAIFNGLGNAKTTVTLSGNTFQINLVTFDTANVAAYTIGSTVGDGTINLDHQGGIAGRVNMNATVANNQLINSNLILGPDAVTSTSYQLNNLSQGGALTVAGNVTGGSTGVAGAKTLLLGGIGNGAVSGIISAGGATTLTLNKTGIGTWTLSGQNTYTAGTTISAGTISVGTSSTYSSGVLTSGPLGTGRVTMSGLGTITGSGAARSIGNEIATNSTAYIAGSQPLTFTGILTNEFPSAGTAYVGVPNTGLTTFSGGINTSSNFIYMEATNNVLVSGPVTSTVVGVQNANGRFYQLGSGTLTLANANSYTSTTGVYGGGTLKLDVSQYASSLTNTPTNYINALSPLQLGGGTFSLVGRANGTTTSAGAWTGSVTSPVITFAGGVPAGIVVGQGVSGTDITGSGTTAYVVSISGNNVTLNANPTNTSGNDFATTATSVLTSQTFASTTLNENRAAAFVVNANGGDGTVLNLGAISRSNGGTINFTLPAGTQSATNGIRTSTTNGTGGILPGWGVVNGADWAVTGAAGTNNVTALPGGSYVSNYGTATTNQNFDALASDTFTNTNVYSMRFNTNIGGTLTASLPVGAFTLGGGGILVTSAVGSNSTIITGGTSLTTGINDLVIHQYNTAGSLEIASLITGAKALTKAGPGTLILSNASNSYTGKTYLTAGTLQISADGNLGTAPGAVGDSLYFNGGTLKLGASFTLNANRRIVWNESGGTIDTGAFNLTYAGPIIANVTSGSVTAPLIKKGSGTLFLSATNSNYKSLYLQEGTLSISTINGNGADGTLGNSNYPVVLGNGSSTVNVQYTGATASSSKKFTVLAGSTGVFDVTTGATILTLSGAIDGGGSLTKTGPGIVILSGANNYAGNTNLNQGTIRLASSSTGIPFGQGRGNLVMSSGTTLDLVTFSPVINGLSGSGTIDASGGTPRLTVGANNATSTFTGVIQNTAGVMGFTKVGAGTFKVTGANTYSGVTSVANGTFLVNGTHSGATVGAYSVAAGALLGGTGTITPSVTTSSISGTIAPGDSTAALAAQTGTLDVGNSFTLATGSSAAFQLGGAAPGDGVGNYDQLNMTNAASSVTLTGTVTLSLSIVNGFIPTFSDIFFIFTRADAGTFSTTFSGLAEGATVNLGGGVTGQITYLASWNGTQGSSLNNGLGNDIAIYNVVAVPEPHEFALAISGLLFLLVVARRRHLRQVA